MLFKKEIYRLHRAYETILSKMGAEAVRFYKQRFDEQSWVNRHTAPWKRPRGQRNGRKTLIHTGTLKRSIRVVRQEKGGKIWIGTDVPYARIHNEGGAIPVTPRMRRFFFAKYRAQKRKNQANPNIDKYLYMAITKKKAFRMPQRQFLGPSQVLEKRITRIIINEIQKTIA